MGVFAMAFFWNDYAQKGGIVIPVVAKRNIMPDET